MSAESPNTLWQLSPSVESDSGYHYGADISLLSQFSAEKEVLFPPCCLLTVIQPAGVDTANCTAENEDGRCFLAVRAKPSFV
jgi:hypothetical protein